MFFECLSSPYFSYIFNQEIASVLGNRKKKEKIETGLKFSYFFCLSFPATGDDWIPAIPLLRTKVYCLRATVQTKPIRPCKVFGIQLYCSAITVSYTT